MLEQKISLYKKREKIHPIKSRGFFTNIRFFFYYFFLFLYFFLPWIQYNNRQSILFDLPSRKFYVFSFTLWPQNFFILYYLIIISILTLLFITVFVGRVWCGYLCPQTVFVNFFVLIEEFFEGKRNNRIKMDKKKINIHFFVKRFLKHCSWILFSFFISYTFVGYFCKKKEFFFFLLKFDIGFFECFFLIFFSFLIYFDAGWMREQICFYMCPYARFQSVMFDRDTIVVAYDLNRGEPRGSRRKNSDYKNIGLGDCIDCNQCVNVCPVGIDIRDGLQLECIHCSACIDKCNEVMHKMGYKKDLIKYTTENKLNGVKSSIVRIKLIMYCSVLLLMVLIFIYSLVFRIPFDVNITRDRGQLYRITFDEKVENTYILKIINMDQKEKVYKVFVNSSKCLDYKGDDVVKVTGNSSVSFDIQLQKQIYSYDSCYIDVYFSFVDLEDLYNKRIVKTVFVEKREN